jgi:hypothetical protein
MKRKKPTTNGSCRCGSLSHKRVSHQECRLNPRNAQNVTPAQPPNPEPMVPEVTPTRAAESICTEVENTVLWDIIDLEAVARSQDSDEESEL